MQCKKEKYLNLIKEMSRNYRCVKFVLAFSPTIAQPRPQGFSLKKMGKSPGEEVEECSTFLDMMNHDIGIDKKQQHYIIKKKL